MKQVTAKNKNTSEKKSKNNTAKKMREAISYVINNDQYEIVDIKKIIDDDEEKFIGDIMFTIKPSEIGITSYVIWKYDKEIFSNFFVNFLGEFIVRENINQFIEFLKENVNFEEMSYDEITKRKHKNFGMKIAGDSIVEFYFHVSLLRNILVENF
jgi:hypothetical protein